MVPPLPGTLPGALPGALPGVSLVLCLVICLFSSWCQPGASSGALPVLIMVSAWCFAGATMVLYSFPTLHSQANCSQEALKKLHHRKSRSLHYDRNLNLSSNIDCRI